MKRGLAGIVLEDRPELADDGLQYRFAHELVTPYLVEQRVLGEQRPSMSHERAQHCKRRGGESDGTPFAQQACIDLVRALNRSNRARTGVGVGEDGAAVRSAIAKRDCLRVVLTTAAREQRRPPGIFEQKTGSYRFDARHSLCACARQSRSLLAAGCDAYAAA